MEPTEVMANKEVMETATEEIVKASSGCGVKTAAGFGLGILAGMVICGLAKPVIARIKERKAEPTIIDVDVTAEEKVEETEQATEDCPE